MKGHGDIVDSLSPVGLSFLISEGVKQGISAIDSAASESDVGLLSREMRRIDRPMGEYPRESISVKVHTPFIKQDLQLREVSPGQELLSVDRDCGFSITTLPGCYLAPAISPGC